jgi:ParB family chromosome partitioning protein
MNTPVKISPLAAAIQRKAGAAASLTNDSKDQLAKVPLTLIDVKKQIRERFETDDQTLADLAADIKRRGVLSAITLRPMGDRYELVCGERRFRAAEIAGLIDIPAIIRPMTDDEATDAQLAENIQRLNLELFEEAKALQRDLDILGSVDAVLEKHNKNKAWLSKRMNLLKLPETAKSLMTEGITADLETVNAVAVIEKISPEAAVAVKEEMKANPKADKRSIVKKHKDAVKPPKENKTGRVTSESTGKTVNQTAKPTIAKNQVEPVQPETLLASEPLRNALDALHSRMMAEAGLKASEALNALPIAIQDQWNDWSYDLYQAGSNAKNVSRVVSQGFASGVFATTGHGLFALSAFLQGVESDRKYDVVDIVANVR